MKDFNEIQNSIDNVFREYLSDLLRLKGQRMKYFYWTINFFENVGNLSFRHYNLTQTDKDKINDFGKIILESTDIYFEINRNSHRNDLTIRNFTKLFSSYTSKIPQTNRYEYIKEYLLWEILSKKEFSSSKVEQQKKNFLHTYLFYLIENNIKPIYPELSNYSNYINTTQGENLLKKINLLKTNENIDNDTLLQKLNNLFISREDQNKLHFVFSREGGEGKEELRELLDVMGKKETGRFYRGQANANWKLDSSLTREPKYLNNESEMYYEILSLKPDSFANDYGVYERLITMQHYGMPTRLMDITRNPLVAIFFACNNLERANVDGIVYTFKKENKDFLNFEDESLKKGLHELFDKNNNQSSTNNNPFLADIWFLRGIAKNQRINSQSGDFIFVGNGSEIEQKLSELPSLTIIIDSDTKKTLLEQLESLNIHGGAVYPDLTHMSNYIRNKFLNDKILNEDELKKLDKKDKPIIKVNKNSSKKLSPEDSEALFEKHFNYKEKPIVVETLVNNFNQNTFWTKSRINKTNSFSREEKLKGDKFIELLNLYYVDDRLPPRSDIANQVMTTKPPLKELESIVKPLQNRIIAFAQELKK